MSIFSSCCHLCMSLPIIYLASSCRSFACNTNIGIRPHNVAKKVMHSHFKYFIFFLHFDEIRLDEIFRILLVYQRLLMGKTVNTYQIQMQSPEFFLIFVIVLRNNCFPLQSSNYGSIRIQMRLQTCFDPNVQLCIQCQGG